MYQRSCALLRRSLRALVLAITLFPWAPGPVFPTVHADDPVIEYRPPERDPTIARLQVVLNYVQIDDDGDWWGKGEFVLGLSMDRFAGDCADPSYCAGPKRGTVRQRIRFSAATGTFYQLDRVLPDETGEDEDLGASPEFGVALHRDEVLRLNFYAWEEDPDIPLGTDFVPGHFPTGPVLRAADGWGTGRHRVRLHDEYDMTVFYEVRQTPLPDLVPHHVIPRKLDDGRDIVCASALNKGLVRSEPFTMTLTVDGVMPPGGSFPMWGLDVAEVGDHCFLTGTLAPGPHQFSVVVDSERAIMEMDESNNRFAEPLALREAPAAGSLMPVGPVRDLAPAAKSAAGPTRAELLPKVIRVKGKEPTGQNDCDPGKNDVMVVVQNEGSAGATPFVVRLLVDDDDDDVLLRTVPSLDPGKETNVEFVGVQLKKGDRKLTATIDPQKLVAESKEDNNELKISVRCKDEGDD